MSKWKFKATLTKDDKRTKYRAGTVFDPKGFYYNGKNVILVGSEGAGHTIRLSFPVDSVKVEVRESFAKPEPGVKWGVWMEKDGDLPEGWWCGSGERQNEHMHRTPLAVDGDFFDWEIDAECQAKDFRILGYPCEVRRLK